MLCRNAWIPPGRGGKSLVTIKVLCIAADSTEPGARGRREAAGRRHGTERAPPDGRGAQVPGIMAPAP